MTIIDRKFSFTVKAYDTPLTFYEAAHESRIGQLHKINDYTETVNKWNAFHKMKNSFVTATESTTIFNFPKNNIRVIFNNVTNDLVNIKHVDLIVVNNTLQCVVVYQNGTIGNNVLMYNTMTSLQAETVKHTEQTQKQEISKTVVITDNDKKPVTIAEAISKLMSEQHGGGLIRILGRMRKIVMKGRTKYIVYKKDLIKLSVAKKLDASINKNKKST
jgi:hypothetical protein